MKCNEVEIVISAKIDGEVTASEWREAEKHIATCQHCAEMLALFEQSTAFLRAEVQHVAPSRNLWPGIAGKIDTQPAIDWRRRLSNWLAGLSGNGTLRADSKWRYGLAGFAAATVLFVAALLSWQMYFGKPADAVSSEDAMRVALQLQDFASLPREQGQALYRQAELVQSLQNYFSQTGLLLMEVKNNDSATDPQTIDAIRMTSKKLLDETVLIKKELEQTDMALVRNVVEQIEAALFDMANIKDETGAEDFELIKASISRKDLLIKIEIIDLRKLPDPKKMTGEASALEPDRSSQI